MLITSDRKFGIEIEFSCPDKMSLYRVSENVKLVDDGSIRHIPHSAEYVSEILEGKSGERKLLDVCELLKKNRASGDNPCMSVHVHLDGKKREYSFGEANNIELTPKNPPFMIGVSSKLARKLGKRNIRKILLRESINFDLNLIVRTTFDSVTYYSLAELKSKPTRNFQYHWLIPLDRFVWLRNMFYFYTQYSQVMEDMVSNSRKFGNMYCIPLHMSYELSDIESCGDMQELKSVWYKGREPEGHRDDSRYHNVNFHAYWDRHGTVEIRSHGGTIDPIKILLWVKLHQKIADKLENLNIEDFKCTDNLHKSFIDFVEEPVLQAYVKRLLGFYSGINIK